MHRLDSRASPSTTVSPVQSENESKGYFSFTFSSSTNEIHFLAAGQNSNFAIRLGRIILFYVGPKAGIYFLVAIHTYVI